MTELQNKRCQWAPDPRLCVFTWTWSQQVSELLLIAGMNKVIDALTQQLQLWTIRNQQNR